MTTILKERGSSGTQPQSFCGSLKLPKRNRPFLLLMEMERDRT
jgi:hypothetical protein